MSKKFNLEDYKGKYVMHCKTEGEAKDFCRVLHEAGRKWYGGESYLDYTFWKADDIFTTLGLLGNERYYHFNEGTYSTRPDVISDYTILHWSDFMNKEFTKDSFRNGDVVLRRNGYVDIFISGRFIREDGSWSNIDAITSDLVSFLEPRYDIMAVIRPVDIFDMTYDAFEKELGRLVYEREETVEMTLEEICKALGKNVKIVKE